MAFSIKLIFIALVTLKVARVTSETKTGEDYKLPNIFSPITYQVDITVTADVFTDAHNEFSGQVLVQFSVTNSTNYIALHSEHDFITINRIVFDNSEIDNGFYSVDNTTDILRIETSDIIAGENYTLAIEYDGLLSTSDMYGFYKSNYVDEDGTKYLLTTMFAATYARRAFPCFDEPALKATFDFSFTFPVGLNVLFNTPQKSSITNETSSLTTVVFDTTPKMSTYLVAFIISEFTCTSGEPIGTVLYQVCSRNASADTRELAVEFGPQLLAGLNNYTSFDYGSAMEKMDQVAIPDFAAGAMENWGLVTYRETALLWDKNESSNRYRQRVVTVIAHEFAHQWFGDLVTLNWWSEIFLNEGFATYFEYHIAHEILPDWELEKQFVIEKMHAALLSDSLENAHALQSDCYTPAEIMARFSTISYSKGASIIRMVEHFMKREHFKAGIQNYIDQHQSSNTEPDDLWLALNDNVLESVSILPTDFTTVMENWVKNSGYPLLSVTVDGKEVTISQKRFLFSGEDTTSKWYVPISYSLSLDPDKFERSSPIIWLTPSNDESFTLPNDCDWIILNNQQSAYYRVNYDDSLWSNIAAALLKDNFDGIGDLNRAQIVDDLFNLARADELKYSRVFEIIDFLANDTSYFSWYPAYSGFDFLLMRVGEGSYMGQMISATILELMSQLYSSVPVLTLNEEDQIYTLKQVLAFTWACRLGNEDCIQHVQTLFSEYKETEERPNKNLRSIVYCNALRYSNDSSDWDFLWEAYNKSSDLATEQVTILSALGCTNDETILKEYLNKSVSDSSGIKSQDALSVFSSVYTGSSVGVDVAFEFLMDNYETIAAKYNSMNSLGNLIKGIAERFTTESQIIQLRNFIETGDLPEEFQVSASEALEIAETNLKWLENFEDDLLRYYGDEGTRISGTILTVAICIIFLLNCK